jgi:hypothetical protein
MAVLPCDPNIIVRLARGRGGLGLALFAFLDSGTFWYDLQSNGDYEVMQVVAMTPERFWKEFSILVRKLEIEVLEVSHFGPAPEFRGKTVHAAHPVATDLTVCLRSMSMSGLGDVPDCPHCLAYIKRGYDMIGRRVYG